MSAAAPAAPRLMRAATALVLLLLAGAYASIAAMSGVTLETLATNAYFALVGVGGAIVANSTGVGGGVVFVPAFASLERVQGVALSPPQIVAMSFVIQSFGMTIGSLTWLNRLARDGSGAVGVSTGDFTRMIAVVLGPCLLALLLSQHALRLAPDLLFLLFKAFSIAMGAVLLGVELLARRRAPRTAPSALDWTCLPLIGLLGGVATALFSVGVGEFAALYLFLRGFPMTTCVPVAVVASAAAVVVGAPHGVATQDIPWAVVLCVIPGAMLGGFLARRLAYFLGARRLKLFTGVWIIASGLFLLVAR